MKAQPRGRAIILNNFKFKDNLRAQREGSEADVKNLDRLFIKLGFTTDKWIDYTKQVMI